MFRISFVFMNETYTGKVQKISLQPVYFVVFDIHPYLHSLPGKLIYESNSEYDQLLYKPFVARHEKILTLVGESIFTACQLQKISVHE